MPSTVTWPSSMDSRSALWVLGEARLISSPTTTLAKIAPGRNSKSRTSWLKTETPVMSLGSRSGVNCTLLTRQSMVRARVFASRVLPTPGTSSTRRWPSASSTVMAVRTTDCLPSMTAFMAAASDADTCRTVSREAPRAGAGASESVEVRRWSSSSLTVIPSSSVVLPTISWCSGCPRSCPTSRRCRRRGDRPPKVLHFPPPHLNWADVEAVHIQSRISVPYGALVE